MAFKQYTTCIPASEYVDFNHLLVATIQSLLVGATATAVAIAKSRLDCWGWLLAVLGTAWLVAYCRLFLYERLICLGGDRDAIGVVSSVSGTTLTGLPDNDFSVNLLLQDNEFGADRATVESSTPYGFLVQAQPSVTARGLGTAGHQSTDQATGKKSEDLHCEFEGGGVYYLLLGAYVAFAAAVAGLILCVYLPPIPFLQQILTALMILVLLALLLGGLIGLASGGSSSDVNPNLGAIHTNDDPNGGQGAGADILYIQGTWVFDPWHVGWNEIHPVKVCTRIGKWDGDWDLPPDVILRVRTQFDDAAAETTKAAQARAENRWVVHPALDGCTSVIIT